MKFSAKCPHCGHQTTAYTLQLNEKLVAAFIGFALMRIKMKRPIKKGEIGLTNAQYSNFQNLRHFGIVRQVERAGPWELTALGWQFYLGQASLKTPVAHMGGVTLEDEHPAWETHTEPRRVVTIRDDFPDLWRERAEYVEEKCLATH